LELPDVESFEAIKGKGVKAKIEGEDFYVGGPNLLKEFNIELTGDVQDFYKTASKKGQTIVFLIGAKDIIGAFALADQVREESYETVKKLHEAGYEVAMLTGDDEAVAKSVADELGIDTYFAEVLPENKDQKIQSLQDEGKKVAMVGGWGQRCPGAHPSGCGDCHRQRHRCGD